MTTHRSYQRARPVREAIRELRDCSGTQFDPAVAEATIAVVERRLAAAPAAFDPVLDAASFEPPTLALG
jgi:HD-GYP domain-containing protein (c-di-GMP phosphodiesterase class II)